MVQVNTEVIGHSGLHICIDTAVIGGNLLFLMECLADSACVIVDQWGTVIKENVWSGFDELRDETFA